MFICFLHVVLDKHDHSVSQLFWKLKSFFFLMCYISTSYSNNIDFLDKGIYVLTKEEMVFSHPQIEKFQLVLASSGILKQLTPHHVPCGISSDQSSGGGKEGWTILWGEGRAYIISGPKERITIHWFRIKLTVTVERTELLTDGGVSPFGDGEEGADEDNFNFLFEGGISLPWSVRGTGSPSNARYTRCIAYNKITSQHSAMNFLKITTVFSQVPKLPLSHSHSDRINDRNKRNLSDSRKKLSLNLNSI